MEELLSSHGDPFWDLSHCFGQPQEVSLFVEYDGSIWLYYPKEIHFTNTKFPL